MIRGIFGGGVRRRIIAAAWSIATLSGCEYDYSLMFSRLPEAATLQFGEDDGGKFEALSKVEFGQFPFASQTTRMIRVRNRGEQPAYRLSLSVANPKNFQIESRCPEELAPKSVAFCEVQVEFEPMEFDELATEIVAQYETMDRGAVIKKEDRLPLAGSGMRWAFLKIVPNAYAPVVATAGVAQPMRVRVFYSGDLLPAEYPRDSIPPAQLGNLLTAASLTNAGAQFLSPTTNSFNPTTAVFVPIAESAPAWSAASSEPCGSIIRRSCDLIANFTPSFPGGTPASGQAVFNGQLALNYHNGQSAGNIARGPVQGRGLNAVDTTGFAISGSVVPGTVSYNPATPATVTVNVTRAGMTSVPAENVVVTLPAPSTGFIQTPSDIAATTCRTGQPIPTTGCTIRMSFRPTSASSNLHTETPRTMTASVGITYNFASFGVSTKPALNVTLTGNAARPARLVFGDTTSTAVSGSVSGLLASVFCSTPRNFTVTNIGGVEATGVRYLVNPTTTTAFTGGPPPTTIAPGATVSLLVSFSPNTVTVHTDSRVIEYLNGSDQTLSNRTAPEPVQIALSGTGTSESRIFNTVWERLAPLSNSSPRRAGEVFPIAIQGARSDSVLGNPRGQVRATINLCGALPLAPFVLNRTVHDHVSVLSPSPGDCQNGVGSWGGGGMRSCTLTFQRDVTPVTLPALAESLLFSPSFTATSGSISTTLSPLHRLSLPPRAVFGAQPAPGVDGIQTGTAASYALTASPLLYGAGAGPQRNEAIRLFYLMNPSADFPVRAAVQLSSVLPAGGITDSPSSGTWSCARGSTSTSGIEIAPEQGCMLYLGYRVTPTTTSASAQLTAFYRNEATGSEVSSGPVPVTATGSVLITPTAPLYTVNFGSVVRGTSRTAGASITVHGTREGLAPENWFVSTSSLPAGISLAPETTADCRTNQGPALPCALPFIYSPVTAGSLDSTITVTYLRNDSSRATFNVRLIGTSIEPTTVITFGSGSSFPKVLMEPMPHSLLTQERTQFISLSNNAPAPPTGASATIVSISVDSADGSFQVSGGSCVVGTVLTAGGGCGIGVRFRPTAVGTRAGTLNVVTRNDVTGVETTSSRPLSGIGVVPIRVYAGGNLTCLRTELAEGVCFGDNSFGQAGQATYSSGSAIPTSRLAFGTSVVDSFALGDAHACAIAITAGGVRQAYCWGKNDQGQTGSGTATATVPAPTLVALGNDSTGAPAQPQALSAGGSHTCALLTDGSVKCWGLNSNAQLGLGDRTARGRSAAQMGAALAIVNLGRPATQVAAGVSHSCALLNNGSVKCWGGNFYGQLGLGSTAADVGSTAAEMAALGTVNHGLSGGVAAVLTSSFNASTCVVGTQGQIRCFGRSVVDTPAGSFTGVLGRCYARSGSSGPDYSRPAQLCWNSPSSFPSDRFGILASDLSSALASTPVPGLVDHAALGGQHACVLLRDFEGVACWGANTYGQLGNNSRDSVGDHEDDFGSGFTITMNGRTIGVVPLQVVAGHHHSCLLTSDNTVRCWGAGALNQNGQVRGGSAPADTQTIGSAIYNGM